MKNCYIVAAGEASLLPENLGADDFLIAADGGLEVLIKNNIKPNLILGDFDSLGYKPEGAEVLELPIEKDDTDTLAAIKYAIKKGAEHIFIYGGTGGRTDHTIANLQALSYIAKNNIEGFLVSEKEIFTVIENKSITFSEKALGNISVFSLSERSKGVNIKGLYYELSDAVLENSYPLGVSNSFKGEEACVSVEDGSLLIVFSTSLDNIL